MFSNAYLVNAKTNSKDGSLRQLSDLSSIAFVNNSQIRVSLPTGTNSFVLIAGCKCLAWVSSDNLWIQVAAPTCSGKLLTCICLPKLGMNFANLHQLIIFGNWYTMSMDILLQRQGKTNPPKADANDRIKTKICGIQYHQKKTFVWIGNLVTKLTHLLKN